MSGRRTPASKQPALRCAVYTRKSTSEGLQQEFNTLDAQREAGEAYVASQGQEGWTSCGTWNPWMWLVLSVP